MRSGVRGGGPISARYRSGISHAPFLAPRRPRRSYPRHRRLRGERPGAGTRRGRRRCLVPERGAAALRLRRRHRYALHRPQRPSLHRRLRTGRRRRDRVRPLPGRPTGKRREPGGGDLPRHGGRWVFVRKVGNILGQGPGRIGFEVVAPSSPWRSCARTTPAAARPVPGATPCRCRKGGGGRASGPAAGSAAPIRPEGVAVDPDREPVVLQGRDDGRGFRPVGERAGTAPGDDVARPGHALERAGELVPGHAERCDPHGPVDRPALARIGRPIPDDRAPAREGRRAGEPASTATTVTRARRRRVGYRVMRALGPGRRDRVTVRPRPLRIPDPHRSNARFRRSEPGNDSHRPSDGGESHNRAVLFGQSLAEASRLVGSDLSPSRSELHGADTTGRQSFGARRKNGGPGRTRTYNQTVMSGV